jgi:DNA polymerase III subunit alpha
MPQYCHLHNHTEYSLLDGAGKIKHMVNKAKSFNMPAIGISDHGNMFGVPQFVLAAQALGIKPIIGSEFYLSRYAIDQKTKDNETYHQILFAKNDIGYKNLIFLSSIAYQQGFYYKPRIDKTLLKAHSDGLIATTCCLASEINQTILKGHVDQAEVLFREYLDIFGEDYYIELQDHNLGDQKKCNPILLEWAKKYQVKTIVTNDVHYVEAADCDAHDMLLALQTGADFSDTNRFRFTDDDKQLNPRFYFKSQEEMAALFPEHPEALENTIEIADKCDVKLDLSGNLILPVYKIPPEFETMDAYLAHLTWEGAKRKYPDLTTEVRERLEHELKIIQGVGYAGYFLIVQEFTNEARKRGVFVGPGRGSAAGSAVAYCIGIIDIDPIAYNLLFERFLNPERISPPDIDIDFDDEGREEVIQFVVEKYGRDCVSQVVTYTTMGAKTAIRDVSRALGLPLAESDRIARLIPERPGMTFEKALTPDENPDHFEALQYAFEDPKVAHMMKLARVLEGTTRNTGVHACALIITPSALSNYVPLAMAKGDVVITQFDGPHAEKAGLLKMDFLGLKTLSIIKTALQIIEQSTGDRIDIDNAPLDKDASPEATKTYELYGKGETIATFQFESEGMRKYLRELQPQHVEDLIAMNALYRPGPMDNIPSFINRRHGREPILYQHPLLESILKNTYGIMVYQEQIMECARLLAGYSLGGADLLRRAMGKKKADVMEKERSVFVEGAQQNGISANIATDIFNTMEKFAAYGFNKSHSAAYTLVAYRTAYLKANYPAAYMAAVLSHNLDHIDKITFFLEECNRMKIEVLAPSVNASDFMFSVQGESQIRFGLGGIKGLGEASAKAIIAERKANGPFQSMFDLVSRLDARMMNKKVVECLGYAGAFDDLLPAGVTRASLFHKEGDESIFLEKVLSYGSKVQQEKNSPQISLFGDAGSTTVLQPPAFPMVDAWSDMMRLNHEKDVIGFYLSGHPLDRFRYEIQAFTNCALKDVEERPNQQIVCAGIVTDFKERMTRKGTPFLTFSLLDYSASYTINLFGDDYAKFRNFITQDAALLVAAKYVERAYQEQQWELKVQKIEFMEKLFEQRNLDLKLNIPLEELDLSLVDKLDQLLRSYPGKANVKFVVDSTSIAGNPILLQPKGLQIRISTELLSQIEALAVQHSFEY